MGTSKETVNQVRNILQKLDRSIDDARSRRLGENEQTLPLRATGTDGPVAPVPPQADPDQPLRARRIERPFR